MLRRYGATGVAIAIAITLVGCTSEGQGADAVLTPSPEPAVKHVQADADAAVLTLDDPELAGYKKVTLPEPEYPPKSEEDCWALYRRAKKDLREAATAHAGESYNKTDDGPYVIHTVTVHDEQFAAAAIDDVRTSYAGPCRTWTNPDGLEFAVSEFEVDDGALDAADEVYGYRIEAGDEKQTLIIFGAYLRKGDLISQIEYAAFDATPADAIVFVVAAAKKLPVA
ncbi:MAG TPA: hypothetical protein VK028_03055 [Micromonosporaceae bacterium]|nr:hypothetical protein [Micromonosporaceae bacterium]